MVADMGWIISRSSRKRRPASTTWMWLTRRSWTPWYKPMSMAYLPAISCPWLARLWHSLAVCLLESVACTKRFLLRSLFDHGEISNVSLVETR